jgi:hypothetical protein
VKLVCHFIHPRETKIRNNAIRWVLLHEMLNRFAEQCGSLVDFVTTIDISDGREVFNALREANFLRRELKSMNIKVVGFGKGFSV